MRPVLLVWNNASALSPSTQSTLAPSEDIRDIRGPIHIPYPWLWLVYLIIGIILALALYKVWRAWKNRKPVVVQPPHERALERLQRAAEFIKTHQGREFSIAVSEAVRSYIEEQFQTRAAQKTTEEFLHGLLANPTSPLAPYSELLKDFLQYCDLAKFARWSLSDEDMQRMYESAMKLIQETRPDRLQPEMEKVS
jgi:hypothetical protein